MTCITNNPLIADNGASRVIWVEGTALDVLFAVRKEVEKGKKLLTHPLPGSLSPAANPYKSVLVDGMAASTDKADLSIVDHAIRLAATQDAFCRNARWDECSCRDFQQIDAALVGAFWGTHP